LLEDSSGLTGRLSANRRKDLDLGGHFWGMGKGVVDNASINSFFQNPLMPYVLALVDQRLIAEGVMVAAFGLKLNAILVDYAHPPGDCSPSILRLPELASS